MIKQLTAFIVFLTLGSSLVSAQANPTNPAKKPSSSKTTSTPKSALENQIKLIKAGNLGALKNTFTPRLRAGITKPLVTQAAALASQWTINDLYGTAQMGQMGGQKTAKIKMKNGRTLTTMVQVNGKWLADTIWFK